MKINAVNNKVSFGLKIVKNDSLREIIDFQLRNDKAPKEMVADCFEKISKLYDDSLSLEFKNNEIKHDGWFGPFIVSNFKISGEMKATDSGNKYPVDFTSIHKNITNGPLMLPGEVKKELQFLQEKTDIEDRKISIFDEIGKEQKIARKALKYLASRRFVIDSATVILQKNGNLYTTGYLCMGGDSTYYYRSNQPLYSNLLYTIEPSGRKSKRKNISLHGSTPKEMALEFAKNYSGKKLYNYKGEYMTTVPEFFKTDNQ